MKKEGTRMIKILIADDEHLVIDFVKFLIENNIDGIEVAGTAKSGREAIEKAVTLKPDIIMMDIRMPGINGLEAIKRIKERGLNSEVVIISAYEYFDYAKEAVQLGVHDYLLKPLNKNKVIDTLRALSQKICDERADVQKQIFLREKVDRILPHMEGQFVHSQLFSDGDVNDIEFYEDIFNMKLGYGYIIVGTISNQEATQTEQAIRYSLERQKFFDIFGISLKKLTNCLIGPPLLDRVLAYVAVDEELDEYEARNQAIAVGTKLAEKLKKSAKVDFKIGVGSLYSIGNFSKSCSEAYTAASLASSGNMAHFDDISLGKANADYYPKNKEKLMIQKAMSGNLSDTLKILEEIMVWMAVDYKDDLDKIKSRMIEIYIQVKRDLPESESFESNFISSLLKINDKSELEYIFAGKIKELVEGLNEVRDAEMSSLISLALDFIKENYNKNISLDDVAKEINMSYHYFSKFFKESTGSKFSDYISELRIEEAKKLLGNPINNIKDVCYAIGYNDPNYFSKIFRKMTGLTPTEYRQKL